MSTTCDFPFVLNCYIIIYCVTLIALFTNFYIEAYQYQRLDRLEIQQALQEKKARMAAGNADSSNYENNSYMLKLKSALGETVGVVNSISKNEAFVDFNGNGPVPYLRR